MIKLYGIKNCDSVRKAVKFCKAREIDYLFVDFRESPLVSSDIGDWIEMGATIKELFNSRSATYRILKLKDKSLDDREKLVWMAKENMLIKRPVIVLDSGRVLVGYDEQLYLDHIS